MITSTHGILHVIHLILPTPPPSEITTGHPYRVYEVWTLNSTPVFPTTLQTQP